MMVSFLKWLASMFGNQNGTSRSTCIPPTNDATSVPQSVGSIEKREKKVILDYRKDANFIQCMRFVFEQECRRMPDGTLDDGYIWDKNDPGGETKYGISKKSYPDVDIKLLALDGAIDIYMRDYWPIAAGLEWPLNVCVFDCAVNQGVKRAAKFLLKSEKKWEVFINVRKQHYISLKDGFFKNNPNRNVYFNSWMRRLTELRKFIEEESA